MCKELLPLRCTVCNRWVDPERFVYHNGRQWPDCPDCDQPLAASTRLLGDPFPLAMALAVATALAKIMAQSGVLERLDACAELSETDLDSLALRIAKAIIQELAGL